MNASRTFLLLVPLLLLIAFTAAAQSNEEAVYYPLDDTYAITLPPGWEVLGQQEGQVAAQGNGLAILVVSPGQIGGDASVPIENGVLLGGTNLAGQEIDPATIITLTISGREAAYSEQTQELGGSTYNGRVYAIRMDDGTIGIVNVVSVGTDLTEAEPFIGQILNTLRAISDYQAMATQQSAPTAQLTLEATRTPRPTRTPTLAPTASITPTFAALSLDAVDQAARLTIRPSDAEATCQIGFLPLEDVLGMLHYNGRLVATDNWITVNFATETEPSAALSLVRVPGTNRYNGRLTAASWTVEVQMELTRDGLPGLSGSPTSAFMITSLNGSTFPCVDQADLILELLP